MEEWLKIEVTQNVLGTVIRADMNQDFVIGPEEVDTLILRLKTLPGVESVDEAQRRALLLSKGNGLDKVVAMVRNLQSQSPQTKSIIT
jgi:hypothetical protein